MGVDPIQTLVVPRVLAATLVSLALSASVILVGLAGAYFFCVYIQHVNPGAFAAGLTLIIGTTDVVIALIKAALFGMSAGLIACYKGISVGAARRVSATPSTRPSSSRSWPCSRSTSWPPPSP